VRAWRCVLDNFCFPFAMLFFLLLYFFNIRCQRAISISIDIATAAVLDSVF
jgi:hypothetical protein